MVQFAVATSIVLAQLVMLAQISYSLPIESGETFEARAIPDVTDSELSKREQVELETREPLLKHVAFGAVAALGAYGAYKWWQNRKQNKAQNGQQPAPQGPSGGGYGSPPSYGNDGNDGQGFTKRHWDDGLEERGWDEFLEERGFGLDELE